MTDTINYDRRVKNLIDELSATGHVTHTRYRKKSVTLHHNGGVRLSHRDILNVWRSRPASAHFDVDFDGDIAQYVEEHEYAWAVGNTQGNAETISIEMANSSGPSRWEVSEDTYKSAARLAGFLFARVVYGRPRPTRHNFFVHHHWSTTSCAGPFVDRHYDEILHLAQRAYDHFRGSTSTGGGSIVRDIQRTLEVDVDGKWGTATDRRARLMRVACRAHAGYPRNHPSDFNITAVQRIIDTTPDGHWGPKSQAALVTWLHGFQRVLNVRADGEWGPATEDRFLKVRENHLIR